MRMSNRIVLFFILILLVLGAHLGYIFIVMVLKNILIPITPYRNVQVEIAPLNTNIQTIS